MLNSNRKLYKIQITLLFVSNNVPLDPMESRFPVIESSIHEEIIEIFDIVTVE